MAKKTAKKKTAKKKKPLSVTLEESIKPNAPECCYFRPHQNGGIGRLLFSLGVIYALNYAGLLEAIPIWVQVMIVAGFTFMRI